MSRSLHSVKDKVVFVLNYSSRHHDICRKTFINLSTKWRQWISFSPHRSNENKDKIIRGFGLRFTELLFHYLEIYITALNVTILIKYKMITVWHRAVVPYFRVLRLNWHGGVQDSRHSVQNGRCSVQESNPLPLEYIWEALLPEPMYSVRCTLLLRRRWSKIWRKKFIKLRCMKPSASNLLSQNDTMQKNVDLVMKWTQ